MKHDQLFKLLLTTFLIEFVRAFLPNVAMYIDPRYVEFLDKEILADIAADAGGKVVDLVDKVRFLSGERAFFLIHVENQANRRKGFGLRMFLYFAGLLKKFGLPVYPVAILLYDRPLKAERDRFEIKFPDFQPLNFAFRAIQLNQLNWRDFVRTPNPVASALMTKMNIAPEDRPSVRFECMRMVATLKLDPAKSKLIGAFMTEYLTLTSAEMVEYNTLVESVAPRERKAVMQVTNEWIEAGVKQGRLEGRQEARRLVDRLLGDRQPSIYPKTCEVAGYNDHGENESYLCSSVFICGSFLFACRDLASVREKQMEPQMNTDEHR